MPTLAPARLRSVNVGLPRDIEWNGRIVHTGIWKSPVAGRCRVHRLHVEGDGQGDLAGHGGENRAVFVYQIESYRYWEERLGRAPFEVGQFGENFTVEGLADADVCIGDRYQIGTAIFEVTQPRVTCYRVGIRTNEPRMALLLTSSGRPGFYFRVLQEGEIGAGDVITRLATGPEGMSVTQVNALLYSSEHPKHELERARSIPALSSGWRSSFDALLREADGSGNAGLAPSAAAHPASPGFLALEVHETVSECADVISLTLVPTTSRPLTTPLPGQFVVLRLQPTPGGRPLFRSYSLSSAPSPERYRISVKIEPRGQAGRLLNQLRAGDHVDVSAPRGSFLLQAGDGPVVFLSAGIGATPVLAMAHALVAASSSREVWWIHGARDGKSHAFAAESKALLETLAKGRRYVLYSRPEAQDVQGRDFDAQGRLSAEVLERLGVPREADMYLCGPPEFMRALTSGLSAWGVPSSRVHSETFVGGESMTPGVVPVGHRAPHAPADEPSTGPLVSFARSGLAAHLDPARHRSLLEMAEACDVPVRWSCRTGVCHSCESGLISGTVTYDPAPLDPPAEGNLLLCCSLPQGDVVLDI